MTAPRFRANVAKWGVLSALFGCTVSSQVHAEQLQLQLRGGAFGLTEGDDDLGRLGVSGGPTVLVKLGQHFALGGTLDGAWIGWSAPASDDGVVLEGSGFPDPDGSMQSMLTALSARFYPVASSTWVPYAQLSAGYVAVVEIPDHPDCGDGSGPSGELALGLDWSLSSWARLGGVAGARPFRFARGCNSIYYPGQPPEPPHGRLIVSLQAAFTTLWSPR